MEGLENNRMGIETSISKNTISAEFCCVSGRLSISKATMQP